ncbi:methionine biosynthesis protein MetW [Candidatus Methylopumilus universalis]|jgi:methionine biosynthesis protein MetW|uniref:Methionine biosynthesis protein MetW n=1 Tax=Candidatus Methylopumilus universalis TaxID=2588536 RepID=A0ABX5VUU1_9PROT|nr:methionine biosynthesis protein MetW [Candidatus Methylopumilus universalis]QDC51599.1 methionine biosynthesis protein MetW [Candidatus Methylopumilus universalis]QDC61736.1 methionine biosynthesis protein MetW [Candidatus Methylopumilus universalis]
MSAQFRQDFAAIANWIPFGAKVLDLGCEDGSLLKFLEGSLEVKGYGIEKDDAHWLNTLKQGINVIQMDLESGLSGFESQSFDVVVLSQTLQAMRNTEKIVHEMLRVGKEAIVTFPNFGYWRHRIQLIQGQMPVSKSLPYEWYNTPNIHLCTIKDFDDFCAKNKIGIKERLILTHGKPIHVMPNLMGALAMYRLVSK